MSQWTVKDADGDVLRTLESEADAVELCARETARLAALPIRNYRLPLRVVEGGA